jgi:hypothetical protein
VEGILDEEVMVVFSGPHAYVSPRWYLEKERVPTWNYAAVHAYGIPRMIEDKALKHESQRRLVASLDPEWLPKFNALRQEYVDMMLDGIVNFEIKVTRFETRWKLSQNRGRLMEGSPRWNARMATVRYRAQAHLVPDHPGHCRRRPQAVVPPVPSGVALTHALDGCAPAAAVPRSRASNPTMWSACYGACRRIW